MESGCLSPASSFLDLPWEIIERIVLQNSLSYRDVVSTMRVTASSHQTVKDFVASAGYSDTLWERKFRSLHPNLYRILVQNPNNKFCRPIDWHALLRTRYEVGRLIGPALTELRNDAMFEYLQMITDQQNRLVSRLLDSQPGDIRYPRSDRETRSYDASVLNTALDYSCIRPVSSKASSQDQERAALCTAFAGSGVLSGASDTFGPLEGSNVMNNIVGRLARDQSGRVTGSDWLTQDHDIVITVAGWIIVDSCQEYVQDLKMADSKSGLASGGESSYGEKTMRMCQFKVSSMEVFSAFASVFSHTADPDLDQFNGLSNEFFVCANFLQACYPACTDVVGTFYANAWNAAAVIRKHLAHAYANHNLVGGMDFVRMLLSFINSVLQEHTADVLPDDLALASGVICNFPYPSVMGTFLPVLTFAFLAQVFLASQKLAVVLKRVMLDIVACDPEGGLKSCRNQIHIMLPCFTADGIDYYCLPRKRQYEGRFPEIISDHALLAAALHKMCFDDVYEVFGTVREINVTFAATVHLPAHLSEYLNGDYRLQYNWDECVIDAVAQRSEQYGGIDFLNKLRGLFGDMIHFRRSAFLEAYCEMPSSGNAATPSDRHQRDRPYNTCKSTKSDTAGTLPVGTVVGIKYRNLTSQLEEESVDHLAAIIMRNSSGGNIDPIEATGEHVCYSLLCLDSPHPNDPYTPPDCARPIENMAVVDRIPEQVRANLHRNVVLWTFFDRFDGVFFIPQPALRQLYPDDCMKQDAIRASMRHKSDNTEN